ncbi:hypothetical protein [Helicobacter pylori]|nr:hypothetical protein [Helicobacter pylori]
MSTAPVFKVHDAKIEMLVENMQRMQAELKVLHDQLVDLVAKQR